MKLQRTKLGQGRGGANAVGVTVACACACYPDKTPPLPRRSPPGLPRRPRRPFSIMMAGSTRTGAAGWPDMTLGYVLLTEEWRPGWVTGAQLERRPPGLNLRHGPQCLQLPGTSIKLPGRVCGTVCQLVTRGRPEVRMQPAAAAMQGHSARHRAAAANATSNGGSHDSPRHPDRSDGLRHHCILFDYLEIPQQMR